MYIVFDRPVKLSNELSRSVSRHGESVGIPASWCRELAVLRMEFALQELSIEELTGVKVTIFGVCSHKFNKSYQKSGWTKKYRPNLTLDLAMQRWFIYTVFLCTQASLGETAEQGETLSTLIRPLVETVGMWQNEPPEEVQELVEEVGPERTEGRGGLYGIPAAVLKSPMMASLLLYLPRVCESLNHNNAHLWNLKTLTGTVKYSYQLPRALTPIIKSFALPLSFTEFGRASFWTMYYLLTRGPEYTEWVFKLNRVDGFQSGIHQLYDQESFPGDIKQFFKDFQDYGFHTIVGTKRVEY